MQKDERGEEVVYQGREVADAEASLYYEMGEEIIKKNLSYLNDVLRQLLTMTVGLAGGSLFFLAPEMCDRSVKLVSTGMFFLAVLFAFAGVLPYRGDICIAYTDELKKLIDAAAWWKRGMIWGTAVCVVLGLLTAVIGVAVK